MSPYKKRLIAAQLIYEIYEVEDLQQLEILLIHLQGSIEDLKEKQLA